MLKPRKSDPLLSQENQLLDFVRRLDKFRDDRRAVHIHLNRLLPHNRRPAQLRIALNTFEFLVKPFDGQIFALNGGDIVFVWKGQEILAIDEAVSRLRHLFRHDPVSLEDETGGEDRFCDWYDLEQRYDAFFASVEKLQDAGQARARRLAKIAGSPEPATETLPPLDPHRLGELIDALAQADLSNLLRRQPVCAIAADSPPVPMFREVYISIDELRAILAPEHDIASDRWLFQHLTQLLDQKMLQLLSKGDDRALEGAVSLNINVSTILSERFLAYDSGLRSAARATIILELQMIDIFSDLGAFVFARDFAKERGYRLCLDGVSDRMLPFVDRERLGVDLVKVAWNQELEQAAPGRQGEMRSLVSGVGAARVILCHCDGAAAIETGRALGINLFQGRHVDALLDRGGRELDSLQKLRAAAQSSPIRR